MRPTGAGIIGAGNIGRAHARAYLENRGVCRLVSAADLDYDRAKQFAAEFGIEADRDAAHLLAREEIDAVSVCTLEGTHREVATAVARAGKHILLEKPIAVSLEDADAIIHAAREAGVVLMVGHTKRFDPRAARARR